MPDLPPEWKSHFAQGVSNRLGSCSRDGEPDICRALGAESLPGGRVQVLVSGITGASVLKAIAETGQVALVLALPSTHRTLHLKGRDARVSVAGPEHQPLLVARREAFIAVLQDYGFTREQVMANWYNLSDGELRLVAFTIHGAWDQSPGPGAGQAVALA